MELPTVISQLDSFYECTGLPFCLCRGDGTPLHGSDGQLDYIYPQYYQYTLLDFRLQKRSADHPLVLLFDPGLFEGVAQLQEDLFLITGPAGPFTQKRAELMRLLQKSTYPEKLARLCDYLSARPLFTLRKFYAAFALMIFLGSGRQLSAEDLEMCNTPLYPLPGEEMPAALFEKRETPARHAELSFEQAVCAAVEHGDPQELRARLRSPLQGDAGVLSTDPLTQIRYTFVSFATLLVRAAIRGGLPQETAFSLGDVYCQQMDRMFDAQAIHALTGQMPMEFCKRVQACRAGRRYTAAVQKCVDYIDKHLHEKIRLTDLAALCGLCTRSISARFKAETGLLLCDYISREKIREAQYLLANSDYTLAEISACLQYNSQSYFTQKFREACGVTPQKYRQTHARLP